MKRFITYLLIISFIVLIIPVFMMKRQSVEVQELDVVEVNELLSEIEDNWDSPNKSYPECSFGYAILNEDEELIFRRGGEHQATTIVGATEERDVMRDITVDGKKVGTLIIYNYLGEMEYLVGQKMLKNYLIAAGMVFAIILGTYIWIWVRVVMPFDKMKEFATAVSSGDLEKPLEMDRENVFGAFTESFDIMREELSLSRQREYEANVSKRELVAQLSHDIKTPVASIKAMSEVLDVKSEQANDEFTNEKVKAIGQKADQIDHLVSNLFSATLKELEHLEVNTAELPSTALVDIIRDADFGDKVKDLDIPECIICMDRIRAGQVITNIIYNSYKYADTEIVVNAFTSEDYLNISFTDKGGGVDEAELSHIMEKFYRGKNADGKEGSGLGLNIAKNLMQDMKGTIECKNVDGGFSVILGFAIS